MSKVMKRIAWAGTAIAIFCTIFYINTKNGPALTLAITFGTISYHFVMRLVVGYIIDFWLNNHVDYQKSWFQVGDAEQAFYKKLRVKKWKGKMGTYDPDSFDPGIHTWEEIAQATCQAELVHETIMVLSFVPILASCLFGELFVFVVTSGLAACFDAMFVIMQRYNRPRIKKLVEREKANRL